MTKNEFDILGDKIKGLEALYTTAVLPEVPMVVRLDGRAFHTFTSGLQRPFDLGFSKCMIETTKTLVEKTHATIGYTQSDEITLVFIPKEKQEHPFAGKVFKICSIFASIASVEFNRLLPDNLPSKVWAFPVFDCRIFSAPNIKTAYEALLWRETDATRNSLSMAVSAYYTHKQMFKKGFADHHEMLHAVGVNWNDYPVHFKRGSYFKRVSFERYMTEQELSFIPEKHRPTGPVIRSKVTEVFTDIKSVSALSPEEVFANSFIGMNQNEKG